LGKCRQCQCHRFFVVSSEDRDKRLSFPECKGGVEMHGWKGNISSRATPIEQIVNGNRMLSGIFANM
jgi:hypothetical protein